jgi:hypothetical protein
MHISRDSAIKLGAVAMLAVVFAEGFLVGRLSTKKKYAELSKQEIKQAKEYYAAKAEEATVEFVPVVDAKQLILDLKYESVEDSIVAATKSTRVPAEILEDEGESRFIKVEVDLNAEFEDAADPLEWNWGQQLANRSEDIPYIIHRDEFEDSTGGAQYSQLSLTYYEEDDVLVDEHSAPIDKYRLIGEDTLQFGLGSGDEHIVYVRNDKMEIDIEITLSPKSYASDVLGLEDETELRHQHQGRKRRFSNDRAYG